MSEVTYPEFIYYMNKTGPTCVLKKELHKIHMHIAEGEKENL